MKKIALTLALLFSLFFFDHFLISIINGEQKTESTETEVLRERILKLEREVYIKELTQYIEFESEVIIPENAKIEDIEYTYNIANELTIPIRIAFRLIYKESNFLDTIKSRAGACGLMQLMPGTRKTYYDLLRVDTLNLSKNKEDIYIGMNYLKDLYSFWQRKGNSKTFSWQLSLASYNAGKGKVIDSKGIPQIKETQDFVGFIAKSHSNPQFLSKFNKKYENKTKMRT